VLRWRPRYRHADSAGLSFRVAAALLAVLFTGSLAAGCGDGGTDNVVVAPSELIPSKPDYISHANGLCAFYESRVEELGKERFHLNAKDFKVLPSGEIIFRPGHRPSDAAIVAFVHDTAVPNLREELAEIRALTPPRGDDARVEAINDAAERAIDALEANPTVYADDAARTRLFAEVKRVGRRYGLRDCGL
jgi:hypothetical protein